MSFLSDILERKAREVEERRARESEDVLERRAERVTPTYRLFDALSPVGGPMRVISEVKRASPSVGSIDSALKAGDLAHRYAQAGAAAISVLTDGPGFGGSLADLSEVRGTVKIPVLRKDFVISRYQLLEARAEGADAVLLIVAALTPVQLTSLHQEAHRLQLDVLVEVHDAAELEIALSSGARIVGINNRNLKTFEVDLGVSEALLPKIPSHLRAVAESGVRGVPEAKRLRQAGAANLLVGEALVRAKDAGALLAALQDIA